MAERFHHDNEHLKLESEPSRATIAPLHFQSEGAVWLTSIFIYMTTLHGDENKQIQKVIIIWLLPRKLKHASYA